MVTVETLSAALMHTFCDVTVNLQGTIFFSHGGNSVIHQVSCSFSGNLICDGKKIGNMKMDIVDVEIAILNAIFVR